MFFQENDWIKLILVQGGTEWMEEMWEESEGKARRSEGMMRVVMKRAEAGEEEGGVFESVS